MKHLSTFLIASFLLLFSCTKQVDDDGSPVHPNTPEMQTIGFCLSRASLETFSEHGITEIGIYVYLKDSLVYGKKLPLADGNLKVDVPLGEKLQTFAVANADHLVDVDSLSKVIIYQDEHAQKEIYVSPVGEFMSDRTVSQVSLELKRIVGQAVFQPSETGEEITAITQFDALNLIFSNVGIGYKVSTSQCVQGTVTVSTNLISGFSGSVYSFSTVNSEKTGVDVVYQKEGVEVNRTKRALDTNITFEPSKRTIISLPILDESYLKYPFSSNRTNHTLKTGVQRSLTIREYDF